MNLKLIFVCKFILLFSTPKVLAGIIKDGPANPRSSPTSALGMTIGHGVVDSSVSPSPQASDQEPESKQEQTEELDTKKSQYYAQMKSFFMNQAKKLNSPTFTLIAQII